MSIDLSWVIRWGTPARTLRNVPVSIATTLVVSNEAGSTLARQHPRLADGLGVLVGVLFEATDEDGSGRSEVARRVRRRRTTTR